MTRPLSAAPPGREQRNGIQMADAGSVGGPGRLACSSFGCWIFVSGLGFTYNPESLALLKKCLYKEIIVTGRFCSVFSKLRSFEFVRLEA